MYKKNGIVYSEPFKYLKVKDRPIIGFSMPGDIELFEELDVNLTDLKIEGRMILFNNKLLGVTPDSLSSDDIKKKVIKSRYTNDDQIAIMLNISRSELDAQAYDRMQKWREFAETVSNLAVKKIADSL